VPKLMAQVTMRGRSATRRGRLRADGIGRTRGLTVTRNLAKLCVGLRSGRSGPPLALIPKLMLYASGAARW
jgi:hypothetical protein